MQRLSRTKQLTLHISCPASSDSTCAYVTHISDKKRLIATMNIILCGCDTPIDFFQRIILFLGKLPPSDDKGNIVLLSKRPPPCPAFQWGCSHGRFVTKGSRQRPVKVIIRESVCLLFIFSKDY